MNLDMRRLSSMTLPMDKDYHLHLMGSKLQKLSIAAGVSILAVLGMAAAMVSPSLVLLNGKGTTSGCANVVFSTSVISVNSAVADNAGYSVDGVAVSNVSYTKGLSTGGDGIRLGSASMNGAVTIGFSTSVSLWQVSVDAAVYSSDSPSLSLASSSSLSSEPVFLSGSSSSNYDLFYSPSSAQSVDSITISGSARFYLYDIRLGLVGGSFTSSSSSIPSSSSSTSSTYSSSSSSSFSHSSSSTPTSSSISNYRRIAPVKAVGDSLSVYNLDGTVNRSLYRSSIANENTWYTSYEDVALYYLGFGGLPANYVLGTGSLEKASAYASFGTKARLYTDYYTRADGYMTAFPAPNAYRYFEADIGGTSDYASGSAWNRGTYRLVIIPGGLQQYGTDFSIFYTTDHYVSFRECYNYADGWSSVFDGEGSGYGSYVTPSTVTLPLV